MKISAASLGALYAEKALADLVNYRPRVPRWWHDVTVRFTLTGEGDIVRASLVSKRILANRITTKKGR